MLKFKCNECDQVSTAGEWQKETERKVIHVAPLNENTVLETLGYHCPKCGDYNDGIMMERIK